MAASQFGILSVFDHNLQTWRTYRSRITQYFVANDITDVTDPKGIKRKAILLSALNDGTHQLVADLARPEEIEGVPYEGILLLLDIHFNPKRVGFGERHNFYAAMQLPGESHTQWAARLRGLTTHCNFLNLEETLRDKFIMGMRPGFEKEKIYSQNLTDLTLAKVVELAENLCRARSAAAAAGGTGAVHDAAPDGNQVYKIVNPGKSGSAGKAKCSVCGYKNHKSSECKFANYVCKGCHVKGHLRRMCTKVNFMLADGGDNGEDDDDGKIFNIRSCRGEPMMETVLIKGLSIKFEIDSGSAVTVISEYASPIVPVLKRDGSVRLCADYSVSLNKQLLIEQYPLPTINELFSKLSGGQQFSKLDLSMAYNQCVLDEQSQDLTCINTHKGLYRYKRLVFGLASAPAVFQRAIEGVLAGLDGVLCLLDDILVTGKDRLEHSERLHAVLKRLQQAGFTLQQQKCEFFKNEVSYLGHIVTKDGLKKCRDKVKAMVEAPTPQNVHQLQSFLGLVNYYRDFVPNASSILSPLYELLKKGCKWNWTSNHDTAFNKMKEMLASERVLTHFDPNAKIILTVDASPSGLGAILSQKGPDGVERPISFASRTLNAAEKRYAQIQKEATAIIYGVRRFHQYLYGRSVPFILRTDHKPLISIFGPYKGIPEVSANRLQRYAMFLSGYNYVIEYIRSSDNSADYLSRASLPPPSPVPAPPAAARARCARTEHCDCDGSEIVECDRATYVCFVTDGTMPVTLKQLQEHTSKDAVLAKVINFIQKGWPPKIHESQLRPYYVCRLQLSVENGCIMRGHKVVVPESLQEAVLTELHSSHLGIVKTKAEARSRCWFPGIDQKIENMIASCEICIQLRPSPSRAPLSSWEYPAGPFSRIHVDFLGPIRGNVYLVIVDAYTKWVEVYIMSSGSSAMVIEKFCDFISRFGIPETIVSDNGTAFCSHEFENFCLTNSISHVTSPVYHAASNGQAESFVKIVKKGIKSCLMTCNTVKDIRVKLLKYLMDYRNSIHTATGLSPAQMVFGRKLRSRLDLINPVSSSPSSSANIHPKQCTQTKTDKIKSVLFNKNDIVLYKKFINKNNYSWCKGIIIKKLGKVLYQVKDFVTSQIIKRHRNQLILYKGVNNNLSSNIWTDIDLPKNDSTDEPTSPPSTPPSIAPSSSSDPQLAASPVPTALHLPALATTPSEPGCAWDPDQSIVATRGRRNDMLIYQPSTPPEAENSSGTDLQVSEAHSDVGSSDEEFQETTAD